MPKKGSIQALNKFFRALLILVIILMTGTIVYKLLNPEMNFFECFYMTLITISTVGFGEISGMTPESRFLTVILIIAGIGLVSYVFFSISQAVVEGLLHEYFGRRKLDRRISKLKDHVILCGYGRVGEIISNQLKKYGKPFVVVEKNPDLETRHDSQIFEVIRNII